MRYEIKYQTFDNLPDIETIIFKENKTSHLYIAGYVEVQTVPQKKIYLIMQLVIFKNMVIFEGDRS